MRFEFLGHACVAIESSSGETLVIDPYAPSGLGGKFAMPALDRVANYVVCSHDHADHNAVTALGGEPQVIVAGQSGDFEVHRYPVFHDEYDGTRFGGSCDIIEVVVDGKRLVHLSDVGEAWTGVELGPVDVLFVPVGGFFTIGALQALEWIRMIAPGEVVPIHAADPRIDLPLHDLAFFEKHWR